MSTFEHRFSVSIIDLHIINKKWFNFISDFPIGSEQGRHSYPVGTNDF